MADMTRPVSSKARPSAETDWMPTVASMSRWAFKSLRQSFWKHACVQGGSHSSSSSSRWCLARKECPACLWVVRVDQQPLARDEKRVASRTQDEIDRSHAAHGTHHLSIMPPGSSKNALPRATSHGPPIPIEAFPVRVAINAHHAAVSALELLAPACCGMALVASARHPFSGNRPLASDVQRRQPIRAGPVRAMHPSSVWTSSKSSRCNSTVRSEREPANVAAQINRRRHHGESKIILMLAKQANPARR